MLQTYHIKKSSKDPRVLLVVMLALCVCISFVYIHEGQTGPLHAVKNALCSVTSPLTHASAQLESVRAYASESLNDTLATSSKLSELQEENESLRAQLAEAEEYRQEAERLESLLDISEKYSVEGVTACVIGKTSEAYDQAVTVDAGSSEGVAVGQSVMGPNGVIGQIISTTDHTATVRLLSDPQSGVAVLLQATREEGVCVGSLEGLLYLENISEDANVQVGDVVVTSGLGGSYTRGLIVGRVVRIDQRQGESTRRIVVSPNEEAGPLQEVMIVSNVGSQGAAA